MDSVILVNDSSLISKLISDIFTPEKTKIISFDIITHNHLSGLNIKHEKVEDYLDENDYELIDRLSLDMSHNWYQLKKISDLLQFENINMGWLLESEITPYFLKILKNFIGVIRIIEKENPSVITGSISITSMAKIIKKNLVIHSHIAPTDATLSFDRVCIPINIGKKLFTIWISRKYALKIKNIMEWITNKIFRFKFSIHNTSKNKSILLLDFNPMFQKTLLKKLTEINKNIILLNERRPAIWNLQSFKAVKQSKSKTIRLKDFLNIQLQHTIQHKQNFLEVNLQKLSTDNSLEEFFSVLGYSFWPTIKENFVDMCLKRFNEAIERFYLSKELFTKIHIDSILVYFAVAPEEKIILHAARGFEIPGIILQHAAYPQSRHMERFFKLFSYVPPPGLKHAVWGKETENYFLQLGVNNNDIMLTGSSKHDEYFHIKNKCTNGKYILLASSVISEHESYGLNTNIFIEFENIIREVCKTCNNIPDKKFIVKLHPGQPTLYDVRPIIHSIDPKISIYKTKDILDLLKNCEVAVFIGPSTSILEAMILDKPTITFRIEPQWYYDDKIFQSGATLLVSTQKEFEIAINEILSNTEFRNKLIQKGKKFVNDYMVNQGNASDIIVSMMK